MFEQATNQKTALLASLLLPFDWAVAVTSPCRPEFTTIRLQHSSTDVYYEMGIREFQVLSNGINIASTGTASQSSTRERRGAANAIDGDIDTFSLTFFGDEIEQSWWQLDFDTPIAADAFKIYNRYCYDPADTECFCDLSDSILSVIDHQGAVVYSTSLRNTCGAAEIDFDFTSSCEAKAWSLDTSSPVSSTSHPSLSPSDRPTVSSQAMTDEPSLDPSSSPSFTLPNKDSPANACPVNARWVKLESTSGLPISMFEFLLFSDGANVAGDGVADQSSSHKPAMSASSANDGDESTFSHTSGADLNAWWSLDMNEERSIDQLSILNRWCVSPNDPNECLCRLSDVRLSMIDEAGSVVHSQLLGDTCNLSQLDLDLTSCDAATISPSSSPSLQHITAEPTAEPSASSTMQTCPVNASKVKIESTSGLPISMFEFQLFSAGINLASDRIATQSSTHKPRMSASSAVDNDATTFSHTLSTDLDAWWSLELNETHILDRVVIQNRWCISPDDPNDCFCRLSGARVSFLDENDAVVSAQILGNTCNAAELDLDLTSCGAATISPSASPTPKPVTSELTVGPSASPTLKPVTPSPSKSPVTASPTTQICPVNARWVKLESTSGLPISMFEFLLFSDGANVAGDGVADQSSSHKPAMSASSANDGDESTFSHTSGADLNAWWSLDMNEERSIDQLSILNRWCISPNDPNECLCRLSDVRLSMIDEAGSVVHSQLLGDTCNLSQLNLDLTSCDATTISPSASPTPKPVTSEPTEGPSAFPTLKPVTPSPSEAPTMKPVTAQPSNSPTLMPVTSKPTKSPTLKPVTPTPNPTSPPSSKPSNAPSVVPTKQPVTSKPTKRPSTASPTKNPVTESPTRNPITSSPSTSPSSSPTAKPLTSSPSSSPSITQTTPGSSDPSVSISVAAILALDNFVIPSSQEDLIGVAETLATTISELISASLNSSETVQSVVITSIGGQSVTAIAAYSALQIMIPMNGRVLESVDVEYVFVIELVCDASSSEAECSNKTNELYVEVTTSLGSNVESGAFEAALHENALLAGDDSLLQAGVSSFLFEAPVIKTSSPASNNSSDAPTSSPSVSINTLSPSSSPSKSPSVSPTSSPVTSSPTVASTTSGPTSMLTLRLSTPDPTMRPTPAPTSSARTAAPTSSSYMSRGTYFAVAVGVVAAYWIL